MAKRWVKRPEGSTWGDFGEDDQLGRLNLLTPEKVLQGIAEVKVGKTFCLSLPLDLPGGNVLNPRRFPPMFYATGPIAEPRYNYPVSRVDPNAPDIVSDDRVLMTLQYSSQWDTLAHVGAMFDADGDGKPEPVYYNGWRAGVDVIGPVDYHGNQPFPDKIGARKLGVENMAEKPIQGRGVLVDLFDMCGPKRTIVSYDMLMRAMEEQKVVVEKGDMLLLHTGFGQLLMDGKGKADPTIMVEGYAQLDGRDQKLLDWITKSEIAALIADNYGVEAMPPSPPTKESPSNLPLHHHCIFKLGLNLGELWYLTELADWLKANKRSRFLLTAPPLRLPGAVGSPPSPVATV